METPKENWDIFKPHKGSTETETMGKSIIKSDTKILQNSLAQIEKLEAAKKELLEALGDCKERLENMNKRLIEVDGYSRLSVYFASKLNSLIKKNNGK